MQTVIRSLNISGRKLRTKRPVSQSRIRHALSSYVACGLTDEILEIIVVEVDDAVQAKASQSSRDREARKEKAREKEKRAARWRTQPRKAPLDSQAHNRLRRTSVSYKSNGVHTKHAISFIASRMLKMNVRNHGSSNAALVGH